MLKKQQDQRVSEWRTRIHDYNHAVKWVKASARPPWLLRKTDGTVVVGPSGGAYALREAWAPLFTGGLGYSPDTDGYLRAYGSHHPQRTVAQDTVLDMGQLKAAVASMQVQAHGPDKWEAAALPRLPEAAWRRLTQTLMAIEATGLWPPALRQSLSPRKAASTESLMSSKLVRLVWGLSSTGLGRRFGSSKPSIPFALMFLPSSSLGASKEGLGRHWDVLITEK